KAAGSRGQPARRDTLSARPDRAIRRRRLARTGGIQCGRAGRIELRLTHSAVRRNAGVRQAGRTIPAAVQSATAAATLAPSAKIAGQARGDRPLATGCAAGAGPARRAGYGPAVESTL